MALVKLTMWTGLIKLVKGRKKLQEIKMVQDTRKPDLLVHLYDENGDRVNATNYTFKISLHNMKDGTTKWAAKSMTEISYALGQIKFVSGAGTDYDTPGTYLAQITGTISAVEEIIQEKFIIIVEKKVPVS